MDKAYIAQMNATIYAGIRAPVAAHGATMRATLRGTCNVKVDPSPRSRSTATASPITQARRLKMDNPSAEPKNR